MTRVTKLQRPLHCHGPGCTLYASYEVLTQESQHAYCRDHLPLKWRPFGGLGTLPSDEAVAAAKFQEEFDNA